MPLRRSSAVRTPRMPRFGQIWIDFVFLRRCFFTNVDVWSIFYDEIQWRLMKTFDLNLISIWYFWWLKLDLERGGACAGTCRECRKGRQGRWTICRETEGRRPGKRTCRRGNLTRLNLKMWNLFLIFWSESLNKLHDCFNFFIFQHQLWCFFRTMSNYLKTKNTRL